MQNKERFIYIGLIALAILFAIVREGCNQKAQDKIVADIVTYKSEAQHYKDKYGQDVATNKALIIQTQEQMKTLLASNDTMKAWLKKFKKIASAAIIKETTTINNVPMPFETKIPCDFKPFRVRKKDKNYSFAGTISSDKFNLDSLSIPNEIKIVVGEKNKGFLGLNKEYMIDAVNSNELMYVSNISAYTFKPEKKWYEKIWFHFAVGAGMGVLGEAYILGKR